MSQDEQWLLKEKYKGKKTKGFFTDLKRLISGEPLAYVIGYVPFLDCQIWLDSHPLIPRPETEYWVEEAIRSIKKKGSEVKILDLCAGSGCIGVAVAKALPKSRVAFAEIDGEHLTTIQENLAQNISMIDNRFELIESNLFENVSGRFDFILTNPPYIDPALDRTEDSVKNYEPHLALYGGQNGLEIIAQIIKQATHHLSSEGELWIEAEPEQMKDIVELLKSAGFHDTKVHVDQYGVDRFVVAVYD